MPASRNKRYNTLDLASKIVCQRQASPPSFGNLQGTGNRISSREIETLMPVFIFPRVPQKCKTVFVTRVENKKGTHGVLDRVAFFSGMRGLRFRYLEVLFFQQNKLMLWFCHGKYILHATIEFITPSGASDFVLGGSTNGCTEWKTKAGKTLDEAFRKKG